MVNNTETDETLKIKVLNISKKELGRTLKKFRGTAWDQSPVFKKDLRGGIRPVRRRAVRLLVGDYYFDHSPHGHAAARRHRAGRRRRRMRRSSPRPTRPSCRLETWDELANPRDLTKIFRRPEYAAWRSLRESEDSRYLGLAMPRFLARLPYGAKTEAVEEFAFEEDTQGADSSKYTWANSAYAMATNITRAFKLYGWTTRIRGVESGGAVEGLPAHTRSRRTMAALP